MSYVVEYWTEEKWDEDCALSWPHSQSRNVINLFKDCSAAVAAISKEISAIPFSEKHRAKNIDNYRVIDDEFGAVVWTLKDGYIVDSVEPEPTTIRVSAGRVWLMVLAMTDGTKKPETFETARHAAFRAVDQLEDGTAVAVESLCEVEAFVEVLG